MASIRNRDALAGIGARRERQGVQRLASSRVRAALDQLASVQERESGRFARARPSRELTEARWAVAVELRNAVEVFRSRRAAAGQAGLTEGEVRRFLAQLPRPADGVEAAHAVPGETSAGTDGDAGDGVGAVPWQA